MNRSILSDLRGLGVFVAVVEQGSFRAAAEQLKLAPSRISEIISDLERGHNVTLLNRTTRSLSLTNEGQLLLAEARAMLDAAERGLDAMHASGADPVGELSVTLPVFVSGTRLMDRIADFAKAHSGVALELHFSDRPADLIRDNYDVAIRAGFSTHSEERSRMIGREERLMVVAPQYAERKPLVREPSDLEDWDWINFQMRPASFLLTHKSGRICEVSGPSRIAADSILSIHELALRGLGATVVPANLGLRAIEAGELLHLLPDWSLEPLTFHAICPSRSRRENLARIFMDFLARA